MIMKPTQAENKRVARAIGKEIKFARIESGYTEQELAERSGCSKKEILAYEAGETMPNAVRLHWILKAMGREGIEI